MRPLRVSQLTALLCTLAIACATAEEIDESSAGGTAGSSGTGFSGSLGGGGASGMGTGGLGGSGGTGGTGATAGAAGASTGGTGGDTCGTVNDCGSAIDLGSVSGDEGGVVTHQAAGSTFVKLRVTEDNHSVFGESLELKLSLQVPGSADVDLYAYLNPDTDQAPCGMLPFAKGDVGGIGQNEVATLAWGDGLTGSGSDDSRTVVIELRHKAGSCDTWTLTAQANP